MHKLAILLSVLLIAGATVPFIPSGYATPAGSIIDLNSGNTLVDGSIVYLDTTSGSPTVDFRVTPGPSEEVTVSELPGAVFSSSAGSNVKLFSWSVSNLPEDVTLPATFAVTFTTTGPSGTSEKNILIAIETERPPVAVTIDRTGYRVDEKATITITDTRSNLNDFISEIIEANVLITGGPTTLSDTVTLEESEEEPGRFVGEYVVSSGKSIKVTYKEQQASANIGLAISFDDSKYNMEDQAHLVVTDLSKKDNAKSGEKIKVNLFSTSLPGKIKLKLTEVANSGVFEATIRPSTSSSLAAGVQKIAAVVGDTITATYKNQIVKATVVQPELRFDREVYGNYEFARITVVDRELNDNKLARENVEVQVTSDSDSAGITNVLIESGLDTATFHSYYMVLLVNDLGIAANADNIHAVYVEDGDTITAKYSDKTVEATADISAVDSSSSFGAPGSGAAEDAQIVFPGITMVDCAAYGDNDNDGLCNNWEPSSTGSALRIPYGGQTHIFAESCGPCPKINKIDVYLEVDYDNSITSYPTDLTTALNNVKNVFAGAPGTGGIVLHYRVDDPVDIPDEVKIWSDDPDDITPEKDSYTEIKQTNFGIVPTWSDPRVYAWAQAMHYVLVINNQTHSPGSSGLAEMVGNDIIISLGSFANSVDQLQGTLMHELGHNLGLDHGGGIDVFPPTPGPPETYVWFDDSDINCKPNYPSTMSYMRQFTNAFTGNTLSYSSGTAPALDVSNLDEDVPFLPTGMSSFTFVYGINNTEYDEDLSSYYDIDLPIGPENPVNFPRIPVVKTVSTSDNLVDWDGDGTIDVESVAGNITDISILGCGISITDGVVLQDHKDWDRLLYASRIYNTPSLSTGSPVWVSGMSDVQWELTKVHAVAAIDRAIQNLDDNDFSFEGDGQATEYGLVLLFDDTGEITVSPNMIGPDTEVTVTIEDTDLDVDDNSIDEYGEDDDLVTFETDRAEVGEAEPEIEETGSNTGVFQFDIQLVTDQQACDDDDLSGAQFQAQGGSDPSIGVCHGDLLIIRYEDENNDDGNMTTVSRVIQVGDFQQEVHNKLMVQDGSNPSVAANVQRFGNPEQAIEQLESLRALMDGSRGGDPDDDVIDEDGQAKVLPIMDSTIAMLKLAEGNEPYLHGIKTFTLTSQQGNEVHTIVGEAETIVPVVDMFTFDPVSKTIMLDLVGQGDVELTIPNDITDEITKATILGEQFEVEEISANDTHTAFLVKDLPYYPRQLSLSYALDDGRGVTTALPFTLTEPVPKNVRGGILLDVVKGTQVVLTTTAKNTGVTSQPFAVIVEVRDADGITVFLAWQTGTLDARGETEVGLSWTPEESGRYEIRVFALDDMSSPEIISETESTTVTVVDSPRGGGGGITLVNP